MTEDEELHQQILAELDWDLALEAKGISVDVLDGAVTLAGEVASHAEKLHAEEAVALVSRVKTLTNNIAVIVRSDHTRTDKEIASAAIKALEWNTALAAHQVTVNVADG